MKYKIISILLALLLVGCANSYQEPSKNEPHATFNTNGKIIPIEINGKSKSGMKLSNWSYRFHPGKISLFVYVPLTTLHAEGGIEFIAENQQTYEPLIENKLETITLNIINSVTNKIVASKELRKGTTSTGAMIPIIIPM